MKRAFRQRPHLVDSALGVVRLDVTSPTDDADEIWLLTYWKDESSYRTWHRGHGFLSKVGIHHVSQGSRVGA